MQQSLVCWWNTITVYVKWTYFTYQNVLHDVPDFDERKKLLSELKNRLEALLSPKLISSFQTHSLGEAQRYVLIFTNIERYPQLKNYYIGCHKASCGLEVYCWQIYSDIFFFQSGIQQLWTSLHSPDKPLLDYLSSFYDELLSKWHGEYSWASQVFPDPLAMLSCVFSEGVESLHPPLSQCLNVAIQAAPQPLTTLLQLRQVPLNTILQPNAGRSQSCCSFFYLFFFVSGSTEICQGVGESCERMWSANGGSLSSGWVDSLSLLSVAGQVPQHGVTAAQTPATLNTTGTSCILDLLHLREQHYSYKISFTHSTKCLMQY